MIVLQLQHTTRKRLHDFSSDNIYVSLKSDKMKPDSSVLILRDKLKPSVIDVQSQSLYFFCKMRI